ncbi:siphovirus Gp157 family protein [Salmonella enterica subsp. enterica serovar Essen]|nr:siphovirus Gp157 family protein [Salmonella enterica subsp. enterica serovar Essen]
MSTAIEIANDYSKLLALLETSDELTPEMIADTLEGIEGELGDKLDAMMIVCCNLQGKAKTCDDEAKRLAARKKSFDGQEKQLRGHMLACLQAAGLKTLKTAKNTYSDTKGKISVIIEDEKLLPDDFVSCDTVITPDKAAIKEAIEAAEAAVADMKARGETPPDELLNPVPGAHLELGSNSLRTR